jgi:1,4-alpha-glucan branching enzyme
VPTSTAGIDRATPLGATVTPAGVTFRLWAPEAREVYVLTDGALPAAERPGFAPSPDDAMIRLGDGSWGALVPDLEDGAPYRFWVVGSGSTGFKRDPRARELSVTPAYPNCDCLVHDPTSYPWHDGGFRAPEFRDFILYQLHIGTYYAVDAQGHDKRRGVGKFLDLLDRVDHLLGLGIN